jgi:sensor histidine kinase YesM
MQGQSNTEGTGIGMANVAERLKVLYSGAASMTVNSSPGSGTLIRLRLPLLDAESALPTAIYERSKTAR